MRSMSEMNLLERLRFLTSKAEQIADRTVSMTDYREFLISPESMDRLDATILRLQVIGEMLKQIDDKTQGRLLIPHYPEIPWRSIFGLRNFISHEYCMVNPEEIFNVVKEDLPLLITVLHRLIADCESGIYNDLLK